MRFPPDHQASSVSSAWPLPGIARIEPRSACGSEGDRLCTTYANGGGPCFGDEGGPLVTEDGFSLIGLVPSRVAGAQECAQDRPPLIELTVLRYWINQHTS